MPLSLEISHVFKTSRDSLVTSCFDSGDSLVASFFSRGSDFSWLTFFFETQLRVSFASSSVFRSINVVHFSVDADILKKFDF